MMGKIKELLMELMEDDEPFEIEFKKKYKALNIEVTKSIKNEILQIFREKISHAVCHQEIF